MIALLGVQHAEPVEGDRELEPPIAGERQQQLDPFEIQGLGLAPATLIRDEGRERDEVAGHQLGIWTGPGEPDREAAARQHLTFGVSARCVVNSGEVVVDGGEVLPMAPGVRCQ